jgi:pimeloyl-ACP methyl ester carboxylesterase
MPAIATLTSMEGLMTTKTVVHKQVQLRHGKTRYIEAGTGAPLILLQISSLESGADDCLASLDALASEYRVLAPDLLGWPPSDTRPGIDAFPALVDFLREFQDALGITKSHVVGVSMGGWIAGLFGYESASRVDKLVLTGNPGFHGSPNDRLASWEVPAEDRVREPLMRMMTGVDPAEAEALVQQKIAKLNEPGFGDAFKSTMITMSNHDNRKRFNLIRRLPTMKMPMLFVIGRGDPSSEVVDQLQKVAPTAKIHIIEEGAHQVHYENTDEFSKVISEFLG